MTGKSGSRLRTATRNGTTLLKRTVMDRAETVLERGQSWCSTMSERRKTPRNRSLKGGKILFNDKRSVITCTVRNLSTVGANLHVRSALGVPAFFELMLDGDTQARSCQVVWKAPNRIGVEFSSPVIRTSPAVHLAHHPEPLAPAATGARGALRIEMLSLRAALDEVPLGIVLLDDGLRARFINGAFRTMWRLPDATAESAPAFATLMYHGRDTRAYDVPDRDLGRYVERRVEHVRGGNPVPIDLRLTSGDIIRFQCTKLPGGGRMLTYTDVTDIVRRSDELERLRGALDNVEQGIILLDENLMVQFMNVAVRRQWQLPEIGATERKLGFDELVANARSSNTFGMVGDALEIYIAQRLARVRAGDPRPMDLRHQDGRIFRCHCSVLSNGGRMLTYTDVTDLVRQTDDVRKLIACSGSS
jgi:PAS domain-containing protein